MFLARSAAELAPLQSARRRLLAVFAHPDDESYGCAGAFARAGADDEAAAALLCMTRGEASSMGPRRGLGPAEVAALREGRLEEVARIVGLDGLVISSFPDGRVAGVPLAETAAAVRAALDAFRPQVVVTHDARGVNGHPDHIAVHWAVRAALELPAPGAAGARLAAVAYTEETAEAAKPRLLFATPEEEIDVVLVLNAAERDAKERCLRVHEGIVTVREDAQPGLIRRPPVERYAFLDGSARVDGEPPADDLFAR